MTVHESRHHGTSNFSEMVGITLNRGAVQRWVLSQSDRSVITRERMKMTGTDTGKTSIILTYCLFRES